MDHLICHVTNTAKSIRRVYRGCAFFLFTPRFSRHLAGVEAREAQNVRAIVHAQNNAAERGARRYQWRLM